MATLTPGLVASEEAFFSPTITTGVVDLTPDLVATEEAFFGPQVDLVIIPAFMVAEEAFFLPAVTGGAVRTNYQAGQTDIRHHKRFAKVGLSR